MCIYPHAERDEWGNYTDDHWLDRCPLKKTRKRCKRCNCACQTHCSTDAIKAQGGFKGASWQAAAAEGLRPQDGD